MCLRILPLGNAQPPFILDRQECCSGCMRYIQSILLPDNIGVKAGILVISGSSIPASNNNKCNSKYSKYYILKM